MSPRKSTLSTEVHPSLDELSSVLRRLHKALLDAEASLYGPIGGPLELLNLAVHHERFTWLRSLSELMVEIDEARDDSEAADNALLAALRTSIEELVGPRTPKDPRFRERYAVLLQQSPAAAMAHGDLRRALDKLPIISFAKPNE